MLELEEEACSSAVHGLEAAKGEASAARLRVAELQVAALAPTPNPNPSPRPFAVLGSHL